MKHGDIVSVNGRYCIALLVSKRLCSRATRALDRVQVSKPGVYLFSGYWYGKDPLDVKSFGKICGKQGRVVGRVRSHEQLIKLLNIVCGK
jgi:hypothetical protein